MPAVPLTIGAYTARSIIASAQRCVNLFPESNPPDAPSPYTFYMRPGLQELSRPPLAIHGRGLYRTSQGELYAAVGNKLYFVDSGFIFHYLGDIEPGFTPCSFIDNGVVLQVATGTIKVGYEVNLLTKAFRRIGSSLGEIKIIDPGQDYDLEPTVTIEAPTGTNGSQATAIAVLEDSGDNEGKIKHIKITDKGSGYNLQQPPRVTITAVGTGSGGSAVALIDEENWLGAVGMGYIDTFMVYSEPLSNRFYSTLSNLTKLDPLYFAAKTGRPDKLQTLAVVHREIWLIGTSTTECWFNAGAPTFPFAEVSGVFIEHGALAPYSIVSHGLEILLLSQDKDGKAVVAMLTSYTLKRISTYAIEQEIRNYVRLDDAVGMIMQLEGHVFYILTFPTADKTWVFDMMEGQWHEWVSYDDNGKEHRHRASAMAFAYGENVCQDWETGTLYRMSLNQYDDVGRPIICRRGFPHMTNGSKRVIYNELIAEMEVGEIPGGVWIYDAWAFSSGFSSGFDIRQPDILFEIDPQVYLRWSDDRGKSWNNPVGQSLGSTGEYLTSVQFQRLGMARNRVFELFWALPVKTALNGASLEATPLGS